MANKRNKGEKPADDEQAQTDDITDAIADFNDTVQPIERPALIAHKFQGATHEHRPKHGTRAAADAHLATMEDVPNGPPGAKILKGGMGGSGAHG